MNFSYCFTSTTVFAGTVTSGICYLGPNFNCIVARTQRKQHTSPFRPHCSTQCYAVSNHSNHNPYSLHCIVHPTSLNQCPVLLLILSHDCYHVDPHYFLFTIKFHVERNAVRLKRRREEKTRKPV